MDKSSSLPPYLLHIIYNKGTEAPSSGEYDIHDTPGTYLCRQCGLALFRSKSKFHSGCGWPSFETAMNHAVREQPDSDGQRMEIVCARCSAHLGHVFHGEHLTSLNTRHCVNSLSLDFVKNQAVIDTEEAILAAGCFWGVEYYFTKLPGVLNVEVGYTGGHTENPSYDQVCNGNTGHYEAVRVVYDPTIISFEKIIKYFFEIHDPTQTDGQGPDIGEQYLSVAFYYNNEQQKIIQSLIKTLREQDLTVVTNVLPVSPFWRAESYHQGYYEKKQKMPYCHRYIKRFN